MLNALLNPRTTLVLLIMMLALYCYAAISLYHLGRAALLSAPTQHPAQVQCETDAACGCADSCLES